jgi:peptide deformylase
MTRLDIVEKGSPVLETPAQEVSLTDIQGKKITKIISDMKETLDAIPDGVGLAAPQIGESVRIFIVSKRVLTRIGKKTKKQLDEVDKMEDLVCINPKIIKASKTKKWFEGEGCLSVRWFYGKVFRSTHVSLEYYDERGQKQIRGAGGLLAHIFQHECDHLDGQLFIDKAKDIEWLEPKNTDVMNDDGTIIAGK